MRLKGINPFEQHVEKAVVVVVGAVALGVLAWQFVGPPNSVTVNRNPVPLDQAYTQLENEAVAVQAKIRQKSVDPADIVIPELDMIARFESRQTGPVARATALAWAGEGSAVGIITPGDTPNSALAVQPLVAPPTSAPKASIYLATISPAEAQADPAVAAILPAAMPFDKAAVSIEAAYDATALRAALAADPDGESGPLAAYRPFWWDGNMQILAVELERQELQADGSWSDHAIVPPMPGRFGLHKDVADPAHTPPTVKELVALATENAALIRRPQYYAIVMGEDWVPPTEVKVGAAPVNQAELTRWTRDHDDALQQIARLDDQLAAIQGDDAQANNRRQNIQRRIDTETQRRDRARDELRKLGAPIEGDEDPVLAEQPVEEAEPPFLSDPAVRLWTHDVTVQRGKIYRYRTVLVLPNPLFGQAAALEPALADLTKEAFVRSKESDWSEPVHVDPDTYYFITSAQDQPANAAIGGGPRAAAELYAFKGGYWRKGTTTLKPGDPIAGEVRMPDLTALMNPAGAAPPPGDGRPPAPNTPTDPPSQPTYIPVPVVLDAFLLDVAAVPAIRDRGIAGANAGAQFQAFLRESDGQITIRNPDFERLGKAYQRVAHSASLGEQALRPKPVVSQTPRPRPDEERPTGPTGPPGGGKGPAGGG